MNFLKIFMYLGALFLVGCIDLNKSSNSDSSSANSLNSSSSSGTKCVVYKITVTSLNTNNWDVSGYGDPFFKLKFNGNYIYTTESKSDISTSSLPITYNINQDIINYKDGVLEFELWDKDPSSNDLLISWDGSSLSRGQTYITLVNYTYNMKATVYLYWEPI